MISNDGQLLPFACRCQTAPALSSDKPQAVRLYLSDLRTKYEYEIPLVKALTLVFVFKISLYGNGHRVGNME